MLHATVLFVCPCVVCCTMCCSPVNVNVESNSSGCVMLAECSCGWKSSSGTSRRSLPTSSSVPSGSSYGCEGNMAAPASNGVSLSRHTTSFTSRTNSACAWLWNEAVVRGGMDTDDTSEPLAVVERWTAYSGVGWLSNTDSDGCC